MGSDQVHTLMIVQKLIGPRTSSKKYDYMIYYDIIIIEFVRPLLNMCKYIYIYIYTCTIFLYT